MSRICCRVQSFLGPSLRSLSASIDAAEEAEREENREEKRGEWRQMSEGLRWDQKKDRANNISVVDYGWKVEEEEIVGGNLDRWKGGRMNFPAKWSDRREESGCVADQRPNPAAV